MKKIIIIAMALTAALWSYSPSLYGPARIAMTAVSLDSPVFSMGMLPSLVTYSPDFAYGISLAAVPYDRTVIAGGASFSIGPTTLPMAIGVNAGYDYLGALDLADDAGGYNGSRMLGTMNAGVVYGISFAELTKVADIKAGIAAKYTGQFLVDSLANAVSFDVSVHYVLPLFAGPITKLGVVLGANDVFSIWLSPNMEGIPVTATAGLFVGLIQDLLTFGVNVTDSGSYADLTSFKWLGMNANLAWAAIPEVLHVRVGGDVNFATLDYKISAGVSYKTGFAWLGYQFGAEGLGLGHTLTLDGKNGKDRYKPIYTSDELKIRNSREIFAQAMVAFSMKDYKKSKQLFEEVLKLDPENAVARSFLAKINELLSLD